MKKIVPGKQGFQHHFPISWNNDLQPKALKSNDTQKISHRPGVCIIPNPSLGVFHSLSPSLSQIRLHLFTRDSKRTLRSLVTGRRERRTPRERRAQPRLPELSAHAAGRTGWDGNASPSGSHGMPLMCQAPLWVLAVNKADSKSVLALMMLAVCRVSTICAESSLSILSGHWPVHWHPPRMNGKRLCSRWLCCGPWREPGPPASASHSPCLPSWSLGLSPAHLYADPDPPLVTGWRVNIKRKGTAHFSGNPQGNWCDCSTEMAPIRAERNIAFIAFGT